MKRNLLAVLGLLSSCAFANNISDKMAEDAFIYAYPMVQDYDFFYETAIKPDYPLNQFQNIRKLADDTYTEHPTINNDTIHLMGWLDVAVEPVVVTIPDMDKGRYWILHTMDMGHYTDAMIGSRTRGTKGGRFMFASKNWHGEVPKSVTQVIRVDSDLVKLMGRIMAINPQDEVIAQNYMDQWNVRTLSQYLGVKGPKAKQRQYPNPKTTNWIEIANFVLCEGILADADKKWLSQYKAIGLAPCKKELTQDQLEAAKIGKKLGMKKIIELAPKMTDARQALGTRESLGNSPREEFAVGVYLGQWGLPPVEAMYLKTDVDSKGKKLNGTHRNYKMRFKAPDVSGFWSVTVYSADNRLMAHNELNRHSRGDRTLKPDSEGYYTILLSSDEQSNKANDNFLPIPEKDFYLILRLYGASKAIQAGEYKMPAVVPVQSREGL
ncbi:MAG: DUF1254 domain-containing protein [Legionella sp.]|uniref:DUF1254 domain-containing protein n=1 Tax=Legionella sp. TaxID=459 RepID=UPI002848DFDE|nr:DUF1254 domain-containing protein [Legionella sp.]